MKSTKRNTNRGYCEREQCMQALAWLRLSGCLDGAGGLPGSSRLTRWRWAGLGITRLSRKVAQNNRLSARWSVLGSSLRKWAAKIDARSPRCGDGEFCAIKKGKRPARQSPRDKARWAMCSFTGMASGVRLLVLRSKLRRRKQIHQLRRSRGIEGLDLPPFCIHPRR